MYIPKPFYTIKKGKKLTINLNSGRIILRASNATSTKDGKRVNLAQIFIIKFRRGLYEETVKND